MKMLKLFVLAIAGFILIPAASADPIRVAKFYKTGADLLVSVGFSISIPDSILFASAGAREH